MDGKATLCTRYLRAITMSINLKHIIRLRLNIRNRSVRLQTFIRDQKPRRSASLTGIATESIGEHHSISKGTVTGNDYPIRSSKRKPAEFVRYAWITLRRLEQAVLLCLGIIPAYLTVTTVTAGSISRQSWHKVWSRFLQSIADPHLEQSNSMSS